MLKKTLKCCGWIVAVIIIVSGIYFCISLYKNNQVGEENSLDLGNLLVIPENDGLSGDDIDLEVNNDSVNGEITQNFNKKQNSENNSENVDLVNETIVDNSSIYEGELEEEILSDEFNFGEEGGYFGNLEEYDNQVIDENKQDTDILENIVVGSSDDILVENLAQDADELINDVVREVNSESELE